MAIAIRQKRERWEAWRREYKEEKQRKEDAKRRAEALRLIRERMVGNMQRWERSNRIHQFCDAVEAATSIDQEIEQAAASWLAWAREQAALLNPLSGDMKELLTLSVEVPDRFKGMEDYERPQPDWWTTSER